MALPPVGYNLRSLFVRRASTALTIVSIAATVGVLIGVLSLRAGFRALFEQGGRSDVAVFLRPGATSEGESAFPRDRAEILVKGTPEIALGEDGQPLAAAELYLAIRRNKVDGGETNVPIRGVQPASFAIHGDRLRIVEGRRFEFGTDELIVGRPLTERIRNCRIGEVLLVNTVPFRVVGIFEHDGAHGSEIWGDVDQIAEPLGRSGFSRVLARLEPDADLGELAARLETDVRTPAQVKTERRYLLDQTTQLSQVLNAVGWFLAVVMGIAAVFTGTNTMLAAISARAREIGILLSIGFRPLGIFVAFLLEAMVLGLLGGAVGCLFTLPLNGIRTGTTNWNTFTEVAFAFRVTPGVLAQAIVFALVLGLVGGAWPALRAARMRPVEALRRL